MTQRLTTRVTYLELLPPFKPPQISPPAIASPQIAILKAENPPLHFYRYLYEQVGKDYHWTDRTKLSDAELAPLLDEENVGLYVLLSGGIPAGFAELAGIDGPDIELKYFGLMPEYKGQGFGKYFLVQMIHLAAQFSPERLLVETCDLDHPAALALYQKMGFNPYAQETREVTPSPPRDGE